LLASRDKTCTETTLCSADVRATRLHPATPSVAASIHLSVDRGITAAVVRRSSPVHVRVAVAVH